MSLPKLQPAEFADFFTALHGEEREPFLWQKRLAASVAAGGGWPHVLDLPTGSGKTAAIDIALFHLALEADLRERRHAPLRIAFVVDRRVIVDAAYDRAVLIRDKLADALNAGKSADVLCRVARRLASFGGEPVLVRALRGGVPREHDWAHTPSQPTILCSTVDQVGSRLLFRGYGVSDSMKPVHAGLIGSDCLILLDEAHLSEPFRQTLAAVDQYRRPPWTEHTPGPWACVTLTATPESRTAPPPSPDARAHVAFALTERERADRRLAPRLSAAKPARLAMAKARTSQPVAHAQAFTEHAWSLSGLDAKESPRIVAVVVNRVALARRCYQEIANRISSNEADAEAVLFIGRTRDVDRSRLMKLHAPKMLSGHRLLEKTLFVIATQCIEAGADFDFDALVTQLAPLDALRQRFGRLNRTGREIPANAVVLACPDEVGAHADEPLYGDRAKATWEWLVAEATEGTVDFGVDAMDARLATVDISKLATQKRNGPVVMPAYLDLWAQTHPIPAADPEPALFLHGAPDAADVQIVWRADVRPADLTAETRERTMALLTLVPPRAAETVAVPIGAARAWLSGSIAPPVNDVEGASSTDEESARGRAIPAFRWRGASSEYSGPVNARDIRPGDVIVVPNLAGGCDEHGWNPESGLRVHDLAAEAARPYARRKFVLRVHRRLLENEFHDQLVRGDREALQHSETTWLSLDRLMQEARNESRAVAMAAKLAGASGLPPSWREALRAIADSKAVSAIFPYDDDDSTRVSGVVFVAERGIDLREDGGTAGDEAITDNDDAGSFRSVPVELTEHSKHVEGRAREFARASGLAEPLARDVALAAFLHDEGKRDDRFQLYLRRGDMLQTLIDGRVLAKSGTGSATRALDALARRRSGLPDKWRHEADSVRRALDHPRLSEAHDRLLVLWLVGTHHGYGRPLYPHFDPRATGPQDLDFRIEGLDWPQIFSTLLRRYGPWELARLESVVRLADHRASEDEESNDESKHREKGRAEAYS